MRLGSLGCHGLATIAVVGGSFGSKRGGQNMLEAVAHHATIVGPDTRNFPDAMALLREETGIIQASSYQDAISSIRELALNQARRDTLGDRGFHTWQQARGAIAYLRRWLDQTRP